jgi:3-vinyl bacteriochlorophyllide hydratase
MNARASIGAEHGFRVGGSGGTEIGFQSGRTLGRDFHVSDIVDGWIDLIAPAPWGAHVGLHSTHHGRGQPRTKPPLYTNEERARRDATPWTMVQAILAPLQFLVFAISLALVARYLLTGRGYEVATASILIKTVLLYTIMITGSIWEKVVFGKWLFARAFFWEDVFSMLVLSLQTVYLASLLLSWGSARQQMLIAMAAYAVYVINAAQFVMKLREARLEGAGRRRRAAVGVGRAA